MPPTPARPSTLHSLILPAAFLALALAVINSGRIPHRVAYDQALYHEAAIRQFAAQWPNVDLSDYLSATTPLFHLIAAAVKYAGLSVAGLQVACAILTAALLWVLIQLSRACGGKGWAACLPFATSLYVFSSGAWILPDNAAWLGVVLLLGLLIAAPLTLRRALLCAIILFLLVLTRQVHLWTAGLIIAAAWLAGAPTLPEQTGPWRPAAALRDLLFTNLGRRCVLASAALLTLLPALLVLIYFYGLWGGLVPPTFQFQYHKANPAGPAFILAVFGAVSVFFAGYVWPCTRRLLCEQPAWAALAAACGLLLALIAPTTAGATSDYLAGRRTGLWDVAAALHDRLHLPNIGHASPLIVALCVFGAITFAACLLAWSGRQRILLIAALIGYGSAIGAGGELWQRYAEPFVLILAALCAARAVGAGWARSRLAPIGPALLSLAFIALCARDLHKQDTRRVSDPPPPAETSAPGQPPPRADSPWSRYHISRGTHPSVHKK
ncbi:MAG: hypothetical protein JSR77_17010 [Planctomycetes bacterium]|nr:hypothetical protein [Planctomycetota bacterium]